ncbi:MAG: hypothetical protein HYS62_03185 [Candidatus Aenigmarchaeota archaeon]|nr:hypothetical protein [Candidatus Aenigmarchaeota archaeon]
MAGFIPEWFLGFDSIIYIFVTMIGFTIGAQLFKLYKLTGDKSHLKLHFGMVVLSMGFLALSMVSGYAYLNFQKTCAVECNIRVFDQAIDIYDFGYWVYYIASLAAYFIIFMVYLPERGQFPAIFPLVWSVGFRTFHLISLFLLSYIIFRSVINYFSDRNVYRFLVMFSFLALGGYHALLFFSTFDPVIYVLGNLSLLTAFLSLLVMVIRVNRK